MSNSKVHRNTLQRQVILNELRKLKTHPTASALHVLVQKRLPKISLGTIYRNLEYLSQIGVIQKLTLSGGEARFDGTIEPHQHVRCVQCNRVDDIIGPPLALPPHDSQDVGGYQIHGYRLEFFGVCPECQQGAVEPDDGSPPPVQS
jgi:Fur family ferric uptake transcriptional regulator